MDIRHFAESDLKEPTEEVNNGNDQLAPMSGEEEEDDRPSQ